MAPFCNASCSQLEVRQLHYGDSKLKTMRMSVYDIDKTPSRRPIIDEDYYKPGQRPGVTVITADASQMRKCMQCRQAISSNLSIPESWEVGSCEPPDGNVSFENVTDFTGENMTGCTSWGVMTLPQDSLPSSVWDRVTIFSRWYQKTKHMVVILFKHGQRPVRDGLPLFFLDPPPTRLELKGPFWIYLRLADEIVMASNLSVLETQDMARKEERKAEEEEMDRIPPNPDYTQQHDILRRILYISEIIKFNASCFESIIKHYMESLQTYEREAGSQKQNQSNSMTSTTTRSRLAYSYQMLIGNLHRSESNYARIQSQIKLGFTKLSLADSNVSLQVAHHTRAKGGSKRTVVIAVALFLPAIYISVVFNTSFFSYSPETGIWRVSSEIWILWVATAGVTVATFAAWYFAQRHFAVLVRRSQKETWEDKRKIPAGKLA